MKSNDTNEERYSSPRIERATLLLKALINDDKYNPSKSKVGKAEQMEFTDRYENLIKIIRAEENRIAYELGHWKEGRGFRTD